MTWSKAHTSFLATGLIVTAAFTVLPAMSLTAQIMALSVAVALLGLPHGAIDAYIARRASLWRSPGGLTVFASVYILIALAVIGVWVLMPTLSLAAFLGISAWHFGADGSPFSKAERWAFGGLLLSLPAFFDPVAVMLLFEALSGPSAHAIVTVLQVIALLAAFALPVMIVTRPQSRFRKMQGAAIVLGLAGFAWALPPLVYFAVYFCALHSPLHFGGVIRLVPRNRQMRAALQTAALTVLTVAFATAAYMVLRDTVALEQATLKVVFVGLAALTVPHMILVDGICRQARRNALVETP